MAYQRKTIDRWDILTNWGYGWECEFSSYNHEYARKILKDYRENTFGRFDVRMEKHREKLLPEKVDRQTDKICCDDVTGWLAEFFESDTSDVPAEAQQHLYEAYEICCKTL